MEWHICDKGLSVGYTFCFYIWLPRSHGIIDCGNGYVEQFPETYIAYTVRFFLEFVVYGWLVYCTGTMFVLR